MSRLSIVGMYNFDPDIFADFSVPTGLQKQNVIDAILLECAGLELLYPSLNIMKVAIRSWTTREFPTWEKLQNTIDIEYNPLWNVDATISETGTNTMERSGTGANTRERAGSGTDDGSDTHSVKGYNSTSWSDSEKVVKDNDQTWSDEESENQTWTDEENGSDTRSIRRTGNIGVTSSQELIRQEREIASFNVTDYIVRSFKNRFCLLVY